MGCCLIGSLAFLLPRIAIATLALFTRYLHDAYDTLLWPVLGFVFMPYTTLAYAYGINTNGGIDGYYVALIVVAALIDLGHFSGGGLLDRRKKKTRPLTRPKPFKSIRQPSGGGGRRPTRWPPPRTPERRRRRRAR
jgi:hypothetical protein